MPVRVDEVVDAGWHALTDVDRVEKPSGLLSRARAWPSDLTALYWWRAR
ncbi:hypothetical protein [Cellulomonas fimi]|nr:hypothetical protein [Cellulomonas fimi]